jgi:hypothetical protein
MKQLIELLMVIAVEVRELFVPGVGLVQHYHLSDGRVAEVVLRPTAE